MSNVQADIIRLIETELRQAADALNASIELAEDRLVNASNGLDVQLVIDSGRMGQTEWEQMLAIGSYKGRRRLLLVNRTDGLRDQQSPLIHVSLEVRLKSVLHLPELWRLIEARLDPVKIKTTIAQTKVATMIVNDFIANLHDTKNEI